MQVTFEVPEEIARAMAAAMGPLDRIAVECFASEGYRSGLLSESQVQHLLGMESRFAVHDWLRKRQIPYRYTEDDLASDLATLTELGIR